MRRIPVAEPVLNGHEKEYVMDCLETGWISGSGKYLNAFEEGFAAFCGTRYAVATFNGTVALHVALLAVGVGAGDEVIVPDLTYIASANAVTYCGATPVLVDVDPHTWTLDIADVERKITSKTKAIMPVHLYGHPADMQPLMALAATHGLKIVEDAAEAHGAAYNGQLVGGIGHVATFSFFGNKVITTGEGGMVVTNDEAVALHVKQLKGQGQDFHRRYWFPIIGYNYRMTNLQAALGLAQLERITWFIERRREVASWYAAQLQGCDLTLPIEASWAKNIYWLYSVVLPKHVNRDQAMQTLAAAGIETRPFFIPMHVLPPYFHADGDQQFPVTTALAAQGINLPTAASLTREEVTYVCDMLKRCISG
ncbi:MAG: DegT/DnrJ/EryC1/StrS family aminotransferase [Anaerolineae bacterium]|nr:DegT/DnrJ/EryC1/StrS family aminotransferase [Anaerolineae bacterium]